MHPLDLDPVLVDRARLGDAAARHVVLAAVAGWLPVASALRYPAYAGREDLCQDVLLQVHLGLGRLQDPACFRSWTFGVLRNCAAARFRHERRRPADPVADPDLLAADGSGRADPEAAAGYAEAWQRGQAALAALPELLREVYALFLEGHTVTELGEILNIPRGTAASRLRKAQIDVRRMLEHSRVPRPGPRLGARAGGA